jgi:hypothetical protein
VIVALVALGFALVASMAANVWLTYRTVRGVEGQAKAEVGATHFESALELAHFELEHTKQALTAADHVIDGLEETLATYLNQPSATGSGLDADDVAGRVMRLARRLGQTARAGRALPAVTGEAVPPDPAAEPPAADLRSPDGPDV